MTCVGVWCSAGNQHLNTERSHTVKGHALDDSVCTCGTWLQSVGLLHELSSNLCRSTKSEEERSTHLKPQSLCLDALDGRNAVHQHITLRAARNRALH